MLVLERTPKPKLVKAEPLTIGEVVTDLQHRGYQLKFRREATCLFCIDLKWCITPESFTVEEYYRFENDLYPDSERTVYAISTTHGFFGFLVDTTMAYQDNISHEMKTKLNPVFFIN